MRADLNNALAAATCSGCKITVTGTHHDFVMLPNGHLILIAGTQQTFSGTVATFTDAGSPDGFGVYTAEINWGDGQTSNGAVSQTGLGAFSVSGAHIYDEENRARVVTTTARTPWHSICPGNC